MTEPAPSRAAHLGAAEDLLRRSEDVSPHATVAQTFALQAIAHAHLASLYPATRTPRKDPQK